MAKEKSVYVCSACGAQSIKWQGKCNSCGAWNTLNEEMLAKKPLRFSPESQNALCSLSDIEISATERLPTGLNELDRALGGGLVEGAVTLIGGDPGIGKSTLLLQVLAHLKNERVLYVSGEESPEQVALRARRLNLNVENLPFLSEIKLERIVDVLKKETPKIVVIDSIQTLWSEELSSAPGSVSQVRECAAQLTRLAKTKKIAIIFVGHVTKEGALAGPRVLEHMVDTVLYFEGDQHLRFRLLRAVKNRFGAVNELGVFAMTEEGLKGIGNPSAIFLSQHASDVPGTSILVTQEGTRPLLVEVQALLDESHGTTPRRLTVGLDAQRLAMLLAVLHRHAGILCHDQDVFVNAVGGVRIVEPAADLAVILSIVSSLKSKALPQGLAVFGEIGLAGEVRPAPRGQERIKEAAKLGFKRLIIPKANAPKQKIAGVELFTIGRIDQAVAILGDF